MFHELVHWSALTNLAGLPPLKDYGMVLDANGVLINNPYTCDPDNGYEPNKCLQLNQQGVVPTENADSYHWFVLEAFWCLKCGRREANMQAPIPARGLRDPLPDSWDGTSG